jgi:FKBP-type peptidyl-prolyl cis-trans isomerase SlyD
MQIEQHSVVAIDYKLTDSDGRVLDSSEGQEPLYYLHGVGTLLPALEKQLLGKTAGNSLSVVLAPEDGYGERNEALRQSVDRGSFEDVPELEVGMQFRVGPGEDQPVFTVIEIEDETVTVDGNHPLAGVELHFDITVREVRAATQEEIDHGHAHGPGGHQH